jgi:transposase-like protein
LIQKSFGRRLNTSLKNAGKSVVASDLKLQLRKGSAEMVAAAIRTIFAQPDAEHVRERLDTISAMLGRQFPKVESMLRDAGPDITAFADFPVPCPVGSFVV